jgi:iron(III) transport system ATP-binding protein
MDQNEITVMAELITEDLRLEGLVKIFGDKERGEVRAVDNLSLHINKGEFVTLLGPSGCGKTTALRLIAGFEHPDAGKIYLGDILINDIPPNKRGAPMVFQSYALFPHLTVYENIAYGPKLKKLSDKVIKNNVEMVLHLVNLIGLENRSPSQLSGGQQQRVALARALVMQPKVLLFDEPLSNLDAKLRVQMRDEIRRLQKRLGITSVYVTHDQVEAMSLSDRIVIINQGRIEQVGDPFEIYRRPASVFVADFIGKANFLESRIEDISTSGIVSFRVMDKLISIPYERREKLEKGKEIYVLIRPEAVSIGSPDANYFGTVRKATYLGPVVEYEVEANGQIISTVDYNPQVKKIYPEGTEVGIKFFDECFHIICNSA